MAPRRRPRSLRNPRHISPRSVCPFINAGATHTCDRQLPNDSTCQTNNLHIRRQRLHYLNTLDTALTGHFVTELNLAPAEPRDAPAVGGASKRAFDLFGAAILLAFFGPLMLAIAA